MSTGNAMRLAVVALIVFWFVTQPYDDTDDGRYKRRSGLSLKTDYGTGCQYLVARGLFAVSITPRLDKSGQQVCAPRL